MIRVLLSFVTSALIVRWLGPEDYGNVSVLLSYTMIFHFLFILGFNQSLTYFVPHYIAQGDWSQAWAALRYAIKVSLLFSLVVLSAVTLYLYISPPTWLDRVGIVATLLLLWQMEIGALSYILSGFLRGVRYFRALVLKDQVVFPIGLLVGAVLFIWMKPFSVIDSDVVGVALAHTTSNVVTLMVGLYFIYILVKKSEALPLDVESMAESQGGELEAKRRWLSYSLPLALQGTLENIFSNLPILILGFILSATQVGELSVCLKIATFSLFFNKGFAPIFMPFLSEASGSNDEDRFAYYFQLLSFWSARFSLLFLFFAATGGSFILEVFGEHYTQSNSLLLWTLMALGVEGTLSGTRDGLVMMGQGHLNIYNLLIGVAALLLGLFLFVPSFGINGAGMALLFCFIVLNGVRVVQLYKVKKCWPFNRKSLFELSLISVGLITLYNIQKHWEMSSKVRFYMSLTACIFLAVALFWREKDLVLGRLKK